MLYKAIYLTRCFHCHCRFYSQINQSDSFSWFSLTPGTSHKLCHFSHVSHISDRLTTHPFTSRNLSADSHLGFISSISMQCFRIKSFSLQSKQQVLNTELRNWNTILHNNNRLKPVIQEECAASETKKNTYPKTASRLFCFKPELRLLNIAISRRPWC